MEMKLSIIIPSHKDPLIHQTIESLLQNMRGEFEIIVVLDGYIPDVPIKNDPRIKVLAIEKNVGMRDAINAGMKLSQGKYLMKCDEHCMFDEGLDIKILDDIEDDWVVIPRRYKLDTDRWVICKDDKEPIDYERLVINRPEKIGGLNWPQRAKERKDILIDETMVFQGSCWFMSRKHWDFLGGLQKEGYGTFAQEAIEIALKTWLGGGKVMVNKKTWYAHKHRKFGRISPVKNYEIDAGNRYSQDYWLNNRWEKRVHNLDWLMARFR